MGHTEKRSVTDVYGELVRDMERNAADPESRFFNGVRAVIIGDRIKRGEEVTEEDRKLWEQKVVASLTTKRDN
ncbi:MULTISPECIES: hypothetical protein [Eikenella]|uniref:CopG family transcriptional regulator n=1 Tax=Eikenella exigua TaxID=2528037 RepID=A0AAX1FA61_9NEIS|nr:MULTISPECIES: hypothetical protein [Eikenella]OAM26540.1 hypothetical protein A7P94_07580 [Eikenella sp. NML01-A-086]QED92994.1 hypothetical protein EZJ17_10035 [Eikenella exigua]